MTGAQKQRVRRAVAHASHASGLLQFRQRIAFRKCAVVLMYHRVLPPAVSVQSWSHPGIIVTPETFEQHMRLVRERFRVVNLADFETRLGSGGDFDSNSCLVTFDDGWFDTYEHAWPILRRYEIPATVFLPSGYIGTADTFWQEHLGQNLHEIWIRARAERCVAAEARKALARFELENVVDFEPSQIRARIMAVVRQRKAGTLADPFEPVRATERWAGQGGPGVDRFMGWDEVRAMSRGGITFGAHGHTHRQLTALSRLEIRTELELSSRALEQELGERPRSFSFPNGDWNELVAEELRHTSFSMAFATQPGPVAPGSNRFAVRRINIHESVTGDGPLFLMRVVAGAGLI